MLKFGLELALEMIQKSGAVIFEILIFRDFSGGQSPKMADLDQNQIFFIFLQSNLHRRNHYFLQNEDPYALR